MRQALSTISVALCTYNGSKHLPEQLDSIAKQTARALELVICDDCSTDDTPQIVRRFSETVEFPVRFSVNPRNLRSTKNFERAIGLCQGSVIALADQDDVWLPDKLAALQQALADNPQAGYVFSDAEVVREDLVPYGYSLWQAIEFSRKAQRRVKQGDAFIELLRHYIVTGATMAFRTEFRDLVLPIPPDWVHDAWISLLISAVADCCFVERSLIRYRQHESQQIGSKKRSLYEKYLVAKKMSLPTYEREANNYAAALERLTVTGKVPPERLERLDQKVQHFRNRCKMRAPGQWRLPYVVRELTSRRYTRYSGGILSVAQDLLLS